MRKTTNARGATGHARRTSEVAVVAGITRASEKPAIGTDSEHFVSVKEAAAFVGCSVGILNKRRMYGLPPRWFKPASFDRVLYPLSGLREWIASGTSGGDVADKA